MGKLLLILIFLALFIGCTDHPYRVVEMEDGTYRVQEDVDYIFRTWQTRGRFFNEEEAIMFYNKLVDEYYKSMRSFSVKRKIRP